MILLSHPSANDTARHAALALHRAGMLGEFWTCEPDDSVPRRQSLPAATLSERIRPPRPASAFSSACRSLDLMVSTRLAVDQFTGVYAYEDGAEQTFRAAGDRGLLRIYGAITGHWKAERDILADEAVREPLWAPTLDDLRRSERQCARRDAELQQSDLIIASSSFFLETLQRESPLNATVAVLPPGIFTTMPREPRSIATTSRLRVLFVGHLGQRQGLSYLFRACRALRSIVDLTVIGTRPAKVSLTLARELAAVRWIEACTPAELSAQMSAHDVLLAPSIFSDFDPTILEALAHSLPVIATPHTVAPDFVDHGAEGFIVPIRSTEAIIEHLALLHRDPDLRHTLSTNAAVRARRHTWESYERALAASVATALAHYR